MECKGTPIKTYYYTVCNGEYDTLKKIEYFTGRYYCESTNNGAPIKYYEIVAKRFFLKKMKFLWVPEYEIRSVETYPVQYED